MTNPFDIITTRIITQSVIDDENNEIEPLGFVEMGMKLYDEGGLTSFLVGWQARVGYWAPLVSFSLAIAQSDRLECKMNGSSILIY